MAIYFMSMKTFGRGGGGSATQAVAYRAGERIRDERTGRVFDYSDRAGVMHTEIVLPSKFEDADMSWAHDRSTLWNAVEAAETRSNSRVAREFLVALPVELSPEQRLQLVRNFTHELVERHGFAADFAIHAPRTDPRNFHAHVLASTREITTEGFGPKTGLEVSDAQRSARGLQPFLREVVDTRERWAILANGALRAAHLDLRIDHRSLEAQGIDREPRLHLPRSVYEMERRGEDNELGRRMRAEHDARVEARVQRAAASVAESTRSAAAERVAEPSSEPQSLEAIRRQARENWLKLRAARLSGSHAASSREPSHGLEEDLGR
jgi:ATP-dependent exoDNAse (exonuclease V) alpha subunit